MCENMKISVITVCLNVELTIEKTLESVVNQTYQEFEYIIIDGQSADGTLNIIKKYEKNKRVKVISEKDSGLYNAMNKGIAVCKGDYVIFLNSGDVFINHNVLSTIAECARADIIYGNVIRVFKDGRMRERYPGKHTVFRLLMMGKMPCHQAIFTRVSLMKNYRFNEEYRICADFDFLIRCKKNKVLMQYVDIDVSMVDCEYGISSRIESLTQMRAEDDRSIRENYFIIYYILWLPKKIIRMFKDLKRFNGKD